MQEERVRTSVFKSGDNELEKLWWCAAAMMKFEQFIELYDKQGGK